MTKIIVIFLFLAGLAASSDSECDSDCTACTVVQYRTPSALYSYAALFPPAVSEEPIPDFQLLVSGKPGGTGFVHVAIGTWSENVASTVMDEAPNLKFNGFALPLRI